MMHRHLESLNHALKVLGQQKYKTHLQAIYLFGSCARGEERYGSDVDLMLVLDSETDARLKRDMKSEVSPDDCNLPEVNLSFADSKESFSTIKQFDSNVRRDGILLWERN